MLNLTFAEWINLFFFLCFMALALIRKNKPGIALGLIGLALTCSVIALEYDVVKNWGPALLMPVAYWQSGRFFRRPNQKMQDLLLTFDEKILGTKKRTSVRTINLLLEISYLFCYPLVPLGIGILYFYGLESHIDRFWQAILPPTYFCYGMVPFQSLPPWRLENQSEPTAPRGQIKETNMWILLHLSTQANTFPSAHVTASLAASLALLSVLPAWGLIFLLISIGIAIGAVVGRYHYVLDVFAAIAVTILSLALVHT